MDPRPLQPVYPAASQRPRVVRQLAYDRLPPAVRDRLERGIVRGALPDPLLAAPSGVAPLARRAALAAAVGAIVAGLGLWFWDLGSLEGQRGVQPASYAAVYGGLVLVVALAGVALIALRSHLRGAPFRSGRYLFPLDLVEASGGRLMVTSLDTVRRVEAHTATLLVCFEDGHEVSLDVPRHLDAATLAVRLEGEIFAARALSLPADLARLERIDPFHEVRVSDDWAAAADPGGGAGRRRSVALAVAGALLAAPAGWELHRLRASVSDDLMFDASSSRLAGLDRGARLVAYLRRGARHREEAERLLIEHADGDRDVLRRYAMRGGHLGALAEDALFDSIKQQPEDLARYLKRRGPRAAEADEALFALARRLDTAASYQTYLEAGTLHADEVNRALLPEAAFRQAARSSQVGSLCTFVRRHPGSSHEDEAWKRIHEAYAAARGAVPGAGAGARFAAAMLAALEERADPRVDLQVRAAPTSAVSDADAVLGAKHGARYLPSAHHFTEGALDLVAREVHAAVGAWFGGAVPKGTAEALGADGEDGRPSVSITLEPVVQGSTGWRSPLSAGSEPDHVTPLVAFLVEVRATVPARDGRPEAAIAWKLRLDDTTNGKVMARDASGVQRSTRQMVDDAFGAFLDGLPARVAGSFDKNL
jgi:hypothetical protein